MARVTVEDCITKIPNRFELVMLAAQRARNISAGMPLTLDRDNDKNPVVALREIADETVELPDLESGIVKGLQRFVESEEPIEEETEVQAIGEATAEETGEATEEAEIMADVLSVQDGVNADAAGEVMVEEGGMPANAFADNVVESEPQEG